MIDEYDHFTNGMLQGDGKRFFATGVTPLTLDSLTSGFNIATKITNNPLFTTMCGLTEEEVKYAIKEADVQNPEEVFNKMQENYDGYIFNIYDKSHIFNTSFVMYYLKDLIRMILYLCYSTMDI